MIRLACFLAFTVAACAPTVAPTADVVQRSPSPARALPPRAPPPPARVEPPEQLQRPALPFSADAILLEPLDDSPNVALFEDERDEIRRRVATWMVAHGHTLVPHAELEAIEAAARRETLSLEQDRRCRAPLRRSDVMDRYFADHPRGRVEAICDFEGACHLQLSIMRGGQEVGFFSSARVRRPEDPRAWLTAASTFRTGMMGAIGLGLSGMSHPPPILFQAPVGIGRWRRAPELEDLGQAEASAAACAHPDPVIGMVWTIRAAIDAKGRVTRCAAEASHSMAREPDARCLCGVFESVRFRSGGPGRRLRMDAVDDGAFSGSAAHFDVVQPGTEAWLERLADAAAARRCIIANTSVRGFTAAVAMQLGDDGTVLDVRVDGDVTTPERMRFAACIVDGLKAVALPCPPPGITTLHARLVVDP